MMDEETLRHIAAQLRQPHGEDAVQVGLNMNEGNHHINLIAIEALQAQPGGHILEIGMGNGMFVRNLFSMYDGIHYTGCDASDVMVQEAHVHNTQLTQDGSAGFLEGRVENLPFENETFDQVFSVNTIYFWDDQATALSEIRRVLKPEGQLLIAIRPRKRMQDYPFTAYGFTMFSKEELTALLSENQFEVLEVVEKDEPDHIINGEKMMLEALIVLAKKS